jgi:hypothetical protein
LIPQEYTLQRSEKEAPETVRVKTYLAGNLDSVAIEMSHRCASFLIVCACVCMCACVCVCACVHVCVCVASCCVVFVLCCVVLWMCIVVDKSLTLTVDC